MSFAPARHFPRMNEMAPFPQFTSLAPLLETVSSLSTVFIVAVFAMHLFAFFVLWLWWRRDLRAIVSSLDDFTRGLRHRSVLGSDGHLTDQIDAFLADVREVAESGAAEDRQSLFHRMSVLDEKRRYLNSMFFETGWNICRTLIEAYPLLGILGTILAIGAALQTGVQTQSVSVGLIVGRFGEAIWSTFAGLAAAIVLMMLNSFLEPGFERLTENRAAVRETVGRAKRELAIRSEKPS